MSTDRTYIYVLLHKPYNYLSQFTPDKEGDLTLKDIPNIPDNVYPVGRLDKDSEGLLLLTDDKPLQHKLSNPASKIWKTYLVVVEGEPDDVALENLRSSVIIRINKKDHLCAPAQVSREDKLPAYLRDGGKPIRFRKDIPTSILSIRISEGKNRQIRKMCAAVGYPVLRLIRIAIDDYQLEGLQSGDIRIL